MVCQSCYTDLSNCCMHFLSKSKPKFGRGFFIYYCCDVRSVSGMSNRVLRVLKRGCVISRIVDVFEAVNAWVRRALGNVFLTLFTPAYFGISLGWGGLGSQFFLEMICLGVIYLIQKEFTKFGCPEPSKKVFYF